MENFLCDLPNFLFSNDSLTFILTSVGLTIAGLGLVTWKKQIKGTKEFEAAYNLHYSILKLRAAIKEVRNPAIWSHESNAAKQYIKEKYPDKSEEYIENNAHANVYEMRWKKIADTSIEMESYLLATEVLWGTDILSLIRPLNKKINELNLAIRQHFEPELKTKNSMVIFDIVYNQSIDNEEDDFSKEINKIIKNVTDYLKSKIS